PLVTWVDQTLNCPNILVPFTGDANQKVSLLDCGLALTLADNTTNKEIVSVQVVDNASSKPLAVPGVRRMRKSATRDSCLGSEPDASVQGQYHARLPCRGWRSQRGRRGTRPTRIARSADAAAAVKPPAFGGLDRPRHSGVGGAGRTSSVAPAFAGRDMR